MQKVAKGRLNIKMPSYEYRDSHVKDRTVSSTVLSLTFQFRWLRGYIHSSCYHHHQIGSINLTHHHIFRGCVPEMFVASYSVTYCIYIPGKPGFCFSLLLCSLWWVQIVGYVLACRSCSFVHYTISLSSLCKLIWRHWTYKMPARYILSSVWVRLSIFSQLSIIQYMGLCVFSLPISLVMIERIYTLSYHHQIGSMNYYPLFMVSSWNNGMRCMSLYILMGITIPGKDGALIQGNKTHPLVKRKKILKACPWTDTFTTLCIFVTYVALGLAFYSVVL